MGQNGAEEQELVVSGGESMTPTPLGLPMQTGSADTPTCGAVCPQCQGRLIRLRDSFRCGRCGFVLCVGCADGEMAGPEAE
jgi:hypothetical protein